MKGVVLFWLMLYGVVAFAQQDTYELSAPINISQNGWNKILQTKNGNTLLFHFENKKGIEVKVFDKKHTEIATELHTGTLADLKALERSFYDGLFEIDGEAVLFITQQIHNVENLYRIRFNSSTGKIISEDNITTSAGFKKNTTAFVLKEHTEDVYYTIAFARNTVEDASIDLRMYNEKHELQKTLPLDMVKKGYDHMHLLNQQIDKSGSILLTVELDKIITYPDVVDKYIVLYYLPKNADKFNAKILKLPRGAKDFNVNYADNTYANTVNIFLSSLASAANASAPQEPATFFYQMLLIADQEMNALNQVELNNTKVTEYLNHKTNNGQTFAGNILAVQANNKGNTTVINEDLLSVNENKGDNAGYIGITEYDHEGKEKWGMVVPKPLHDNSSYKHDASEVFKVRTSEYELSRTLCITAKNSHYIIYNDLDKNFDKQPGNQFEFINDFKETNAVCYRLNKKKELSKSYLLGAPVAGEYKHIYTHSGSFDRSKNIYATIVQYRKGGNTSTHLAWCQIDN